MSATRQVDFAGVLPLQVLEHRAERHDFTKWERAYLQALHQYLAPGMVVYDVGAEEGEISAFVGKHVGGANVHLFEPRAAIWPNIRAVWEANGLHLPGGCWSGFVGDNVDAPAVPVITGKIWPGTWPNESAGEIVMDSAFPELRSRGEVPVTSLDHYARTNHAPDVILCDVEGAEVLVLMGARNLLLSRRPTVFLSLHPFTEQYGQQQQHLFALMITHGYRMIYLGYDHEGHWVFYHPAGAYRDGIPRVRGNDDSSW